MISHSTCPKRSLTALLPSDFPFPSPSFYTKTFQQYNWATSRLYSQNIVALIVYRNFNPPNVINLEFVRLLITMLALFLSFLILYDPCPWQYFFLPLISCWSMLCNCQRFIANPLYSRLVSQALSILLYTMLSNIKHDKEMAPLVNTFLEKLSQNRPLYHTQTSCISRCHTTFLPTNL